MRSPVVRGPMANPPPDILGAIAELEKSVAALKGQLTNPAARPHHIDEALVEITTDAEWLEGVTNQWLRKETRRGY